MSPDDKRKFFEILTVASGFYGKELDQASAAVWWQALERYPLEDVKDAFTTHLQDPDRGQFPPKPADIIRAIDGDTDSRAQAAWAKVIRAVKTVGPYQDIVFDDPAIHACIQDMGGWIKFGEMTEEEEPFRAQDFRRLYKRAAHKPGAYPRLLRGMSGAHNSAHRLQEPVEQPPVMVGERAKCLEVYQQGTDAPALPVTRFRSLAQFMETAIAQIEDKRE